MGNMDGQSGNVTSSTFLHHLRDLWKSPRGTVVRIESLAGVAIITAFLLAAFGSSRRWSNRWIVQKGFFAAHALSLSLGTYSIGLMQTSPVKSKMYPIWTVSLFTLFGCIDPVTNNNGLDYKGPLSKSLFGIFLNCGYVLFMSNSGIFSDTGNTAINVLAAITFIKSFHRSLALVEQSRMRKRVQGLEDLFGDRYGLPEAGGMNVDFIPYNAYERRSCIRIEDVEAGLRGHKNELCYRSCYDACVAFSLSHKLQRHFLGLGDESWEYPNTRIGIDYMWILKVIEIELAFLYDIFFTGYPFLHYYQAKAASLWTLASFIGICFVGIAAVTPGTITSRPTAVSPGRCTNIVDTTALDLGFTFVILVSLALLQLMHLIQGWTSNWARCSVAWAYGMKGWEEDDWSRFFEMSEHGFNHCTRPFWWPWWMRLKASVATSTTWFNKYLWQEKIGQCSILPGGRLLTREKGVKRRRRILCGYMNCIVYQPYLWLFASSLIKMLGVHYIWEVMRDLLGNDTNKGATVRLDDDVKESIIQFLDHIRTERLDENWLHLPDDHPLFRFHLLYFHDSPLLYDRDSRSQGYRYTRCVTTWHTATCYCEREEREWEEALPLTKAETAAGERERNQDRSRNRRVANILSNYCIYLVVSAPELLPGPAMETRFAYDSFAKEVNALQGKYDLEDDDDDPDDLEDDDDDPDDLEDDDDDPDPDTRYGNGMDIAKRFLGKYDLEGDVTRPSDELRETLALVWVRLLLYAAPYGNVEAHMRHLAQGGEFITHLWALLFHLGIREWKYPEEDIHIITNLEDAQKILTKDEDDLDIIVVALFATPDMQQKYRDDFVTTSRLIDGVKFYLTSSPDVAKSLYFPESILQSALEHMSVLVLNKVENKTAFLDYSRVHKWNGPYDVALFVYETKLAWAKERAQEASTSTFHDPIPIAKQGSEDGQTVVEIEEEIPPPLSSS